jgi:hypothetical protein
MVPEPWRRGGHDVNGDDEPGRADEVDDAALRRWLAELRVDDAARERSRTAELEARAAEEATLAGVLVELAERGESIGLTMRSGAQHRGVVRLVGPDAVVMLLETRQWLVARVASIASLRALNSPPVTGATEPSTASRYPRLAAAVAEPGTWVVASSGPTNVGGTLVSAGSDVMLVRLESGDHAYVALAATDTIATRPSR